MKIEFNQLEGIEVKGAEFLSDALIAHGGEKSLNSMGLSSVREQWGLSKFYIQSVGRLFELPRTREQDVREICNLT